MGFSLGIDRVLRDANLQRELAGRKLALVAHPASMTSDFRHSMDALMSAGLKITAAFGPQHGMRGEKQDNMIETEDFVDPRYQIPVHSLYGQVRRPTPAMMQGWDVLLFDLQDVGTRIYTFLTTLFFLLEESARAGKEVWILDRPNPAGRPAEGSLLEPGWTSFVGCSEGLPMRHGLTLGEAAGWLKAHHKLDVALRIIEMENYRINESPGFGWPLADLPWVNPSPNAATLSMARCFPGTVMVEGTTLSEGRGTTRPLELLGAPDIDASAVLEEMRRLAPRWLEGVQLRPCFFQPTFHKHVGEMCSGVQLHVDGPKYRHGVFRPYRFVSLWFKAIRNLHPDYPIWRDFHYEYETERRAIDLINGGPFLRQWVDDRSALAGDFEARVQKDEAQWLKEREDHLLYRL